MLDGDALWNLLPGTYEERDRLRDCILALRPDPRIERLVEVIRLTVEYVGTDMLPAIPGWSWNDALIKPARISEGIELSYGGPYKMEAKLAAIEALCVEMAQDGLPVMRHYTRRLRAIIKGGS